MKYKKAQMGNMLHLVIIAVVILIAALAIVLLVTQTTNDVSEKSGSQIDSSASGIDESIGELTMTCPGTCTGKVHKIKFTKCGSNCLNNTYYCCYKAKGNYGDGESVGTGECTHISQCQ